MKQTKAAAMNAKAAAAIQGGHAGERHVLAGKASKSNGTEVPRVIRDETNVIIPSL